MILGYIFVSHCNSVLIHIAIFFEKFEKAVKL